MLAERGDVVGYWTRSTLSLMFKGEKGEKPCQRVDLAGGARRVPKIADVLLDLLSASCSSSMREVESLAITAQLLPDYLRPDIEAKPEVGRGSSLPSSRPDDPRTRVTMIRQVAINEPGGSWSDPISIFNDGVITQYRNDTIFGLPYLSTSRSLRLRMSKPLTIADPIFLSNRASIKEARTRENVGRVY